VIKDQSRTVMFTYRAKELARLGRVFSELETEATRLLRAEGFARSRQRHERSFAMRYQGQSFELDIQKTTGDSAAAFHRAHRERYGYAKENGEIEIVSVRLRSFGLVEKLAQRKISASRQRGKTKPPGKVTAHLDARNVKVGLYRRDELRAGAKLETPCIVSEYSATTLIPADTSARVDQFGNLLIEVSK